PEQAASLLTEIERTAVDHDARVIFRTAGADSPLPRKLPATLQAGWRYFAGQSRELFARDRSSIYGGFHLYARAAACMHRPIPCCWAAAIGISAIFIISPAPRIRFARHPYFR